MTGPGNFKDSLHWTHTERHRGGTAVSSLDVRRVAAKAVWRERRRRWKRGGAAFLARRLMGVRHVLRRLLARLERARANAGTAGHRSHAGRAATREVATPPVGASAAADKSRAAGG